MKLILTLFSRLSIQNAWGKTSHPKDSFKMILVFKKNPRIYGVWDLKRASMRKLRKKRWKRLKLGHQDNKIIFKKGRLIQISPILGNIDGTLQKHYDTEEIRTIKKGQKYFFPSIDKDRLVQFNQFGPMKRPHLKSLTCYRKRRIFKCYAKGRMVNAGKKRWLKIHRQKNLSLFRKMKKSGKRI